MFPAFARGDFCPALELCRLCGRGARPFTRALRRLLGAGTADGKKLGGQSLGRRPSSALSSAPAWTSRTARSPRLSPSGWVTHDEAAACYDLANGNLRAGWTGGFLRFDPARYGIVNKPALAGAPRLFAPAANGWLDGNAAYRGLTLHGSQLLLRFDVAGAEVRETPGFIAGEKVAVWTRSFALAPCARMRRLAVLEGAKNGQATSEMIDGVKIIRIATRTGQTCAAVTGDAGVTLHAEDGLIVADFPAHDAAHTAQVFLSSASQDEVAEFARLVKEHSGAVDFAELARPTAPRWEPLTTQGQLGAGSEAYLIDTITAPYDNPWKALLFFSGLDFLPTGELVACSSRGRVAGLGSGPES